MWTPTNIPSGRTSYPQFPRSNACKANDRERSTDLACSHTNSGSQKHKLNLTCDHTNSGSTRQPPNPRMHYGPCAKKDKTKSRARTRLKLTRSHTNSGSTRQPPKPENAVS